MTEHNSMTSGGRTKRILALAQKNPMFRNKLLTLGALGDQMTYPSMGVFQRFAPLMLEIASEAGLLDGIDQSTMDELNEWFSDSANELAYLVQSRQRIPPSRKYRKPIGHVFVSWTVKNPRDREATRGIKAALDWFNIDYFDYTEHQLDDERDMTAQITQQLKDAIAKSRFSVEIVSTETGRPWVQFERSLVAQNSNIHRFLACLESEKATFVRMSADLESRATRIDISGGRSGTIPTANMDRWMEQAANTGYFGTADFSYKCYEVADVIRSQLSGKRKRHPFFSCIDAFRFSVVCQQMYQRRRQLEAECLR
jgi:hypothetical protein